jgi:RNA polymerase sigma-70 factor (ECF subfamily)
MTKEEFQHIIHPLTDKLFRFAVNMMHNIHEAEDIVQEVLLRLWQQQEKLSNVENVEAWSIRITRNLSIDKLRSKKKLEEEDKLLTLATAEDSPEMVLYQKDFLRHIENLMQLLPEKQKMVMHLRDIEGYSYEEIATLLEIPLNQVKVNLFRARNFMRLQLMSHDANIM